MINQAERSLELFSDSAEEKNDVLRLFNILANLQNDAERYCKKFDELCKSGAIDGFQYEMISAGLATFSLACKELGVRVDAIKRLIIE